MGQVFVCDWCKEPTDADSVVKIGFKAGKGRWGNTWDLCSDCKSEIQTRLVQTKLAKPSRSVATPQTTDFDPEEEEAEPQTLGDLDLTDDRTTVEKLRDGVSDEKIVAQIERDHSMRTSAKTAKQHQRIQQDMPRDGSVDSDECLHANREATITWEFETRTLPSGKETKVRVPYHRCRDCDQLIKHKSRVHKSRSLNLSGGDGVNFREGGGKTK